MKRKYLESAVAYCTRSKRPKLCTLLPRSQTKLEYIPATCTRNYMLKDPLVDWLKLHGNRNTSIRSDNDGFTSFIMERGIDFEDKLVKYINNNFLPIVSVSEYITNESIKKTISLMKDGTPIIHSAPVRNPKTRTHGIIDLLVRSDYLHKIVDDCPLSDAEKNIPSPNLGHNFHYVVIDVKFSTLPLSSDGRHILNSGSYPAYKSQCLIYTDAVGNIQGYKSRYAFILGRRWKFTRKNINYNGLSCLDKLGVIDYKNFDKSYIEQTSNALKWIRENKKYGHEWSVSPPSRQELYPNMCYYSGKWEQQKEKIADNIGEITNVWYCGTKHRNIAINNGITSWRDPRCTSKNIGINGIRAPIIDSILNINRQNNDIIRPKNIKNNMFNWKKTENEMFVDFETLSDIFSPLSDLPKQKYTDMIFMIGVWYKKSKQWTYKRFTCNKTTYEEEYRIMDQFTTFVRKHGNPRLWYWCAENKFWSKSELRQINLTSEDEKKTNRITKFWKLHNWVDMCQIFKQEPIVIKGCFKFGLKPIARAMYKHKLINTTLESDCTSGMTAMIKAWKCYNDFPKPANCPIMQDIAKYNKFDVKVLRDILTYLRKNHT